jgi:2-polyprenyl-6-methoxyphenol hydroxylase-like FAD-dependent oxidoreductase
MPKFKETEVDIVIVGAGPLGLLNAIGLMKNKKPQPKIVMLEKYEQYQRGHNLSVDHLQLKKFIKACGDDQKLNELYKRIKSNKRIRTNEVERFLREYAEELGVEIKTGTAVTDVEHEVYSAYPNAKLILGADGSHSTVSKQVFGEGNIQKFPFDYVMQLRFEVEGDGLVKSCGLDALSAFMQAYGVACQEFVGKKGQDGKTPITFQVMISKEHFEQLYPIATSKSPILPFSAKQEKREQVPSQLIDLVKGYLGMRISHSTNNMQLVRVDDAKISVNEAPATRAKSVIRQEGNGRATVLVGDAALGLSYFKGLNAGIENAAKLLPALCSDDKKKLKDYEEWFDKDLAPRKVAEVESYSSYRIRLPEKIFGFFRGLLGKQCFLNTSEAENITESYVGYIHHLQKENSDQRPPFRTYPHREKPESPLFTLQPENALEYAQQTKKYFVEFGKAYKSTYHFLRDLAQPLRSIYHLGASILKIGFALPILVLKAASSLIFPGKEQTRGQRLKYDFINFGMRLSEGFSQFALATVLTFGIILYPFKLITRGIQTVIAHSKNEEPLLVENNKGIRRLLQQENNDSIGTYNALRVQLHRKYHNAVAKGHSSCINKFDEEKAFNACRPDDLQTYVQYLSLFKTANKQDISTAAQKSEIQPKF